MPNPTCVLCGKRGYEDTHFCRACLMATYPPVRAIDAVGTVRFEVGFREEKKSRLPFLATALGLAVLALLLAALVVLSIG